MAMRTFLRFILEKRLIEVEWNIATAMWELAG
jgi:hypothetical protein